MAKPRDYGAEYAQRKARGAARGLTGSAIRGHAPKPGKTEAQERREREAAQKAALGKLTTPERAAIRRWTRNRAEANGIDADTAIEEMLEWTTIHGWDRFVTERAFIENLGMQGMSMAQIEYRSASGQGFPDPRLYWYRRRETMKGHAWTPRTPSQRNRRRIRERRARRAARKQQTAKRKSR